MAGGYDGEIRIRTLIENGKASSQLLQLEARFQKLTSEAKNLADGMREIEQMKIPTDDYKAVQDQISKAEAKLDALNDRMQKFKELGGKTNSQTFKGMQYDAEQLANTIKYARGELLDMESSGTAYVDPKGTEEYQKKAEKLCEVNRQLDVTKKKMEEVAAKEAKVGSGAKQIEKVGKAAKKSAGLMTTFLSRLKGITLSLFIFNWITKGFNAMVAAFKEGIQNMAKYSADFNSRMSELKTATSTLKASLGTLAAPIVSAIIPAIVTLCSWITTAVNKMNELVAALSGKSTWTRAKQQQVDYAKSLNSTAGAAKKAARALQGFDELNVINSNSSGGGGGGTDASTMYEEVPTSDALIGKLQPFLAYLKQIKAEVIRGWDETWAALDIDSQIADIRGSIESIRGSLSDIFGNADLQAAADNFVMTLAYSVGQIGASVVSIGATIAQNIIGGIDLYLQQNSGRITEYLIRMFDIGADVAQLAGEAAEAFAFVFQAFGNEDGQQITANLIQMFSDIFGTVTLLVAQFRDDLMHLFVDPFVNNSDSIKTALEGILEVVSEVTTTISEIVRQTTDGIVKLYDEHISPFITSINEGVSELIEKFLEFWNTYMQPILEEWAAMFEDTYQNHLKPVIDKVIECVGKIIDILKILWENWIQPLIAWVIENILPVITPILDSLSQYVKGCIDGIIDFVDGLLNAVSDVLDVIIKLLKGDWKGAWEAAKKVVKDVVNGILAAVESMANGVVNAVNTMIRALNGLHFDIPEWVPVLGGKTFGFNIGEISAVHIPRLANGGITTGSTLANIGEAGREAVLPLENNLSYLEPLAEMIASKMEGVQTVRIVAEESGIFKVVREGANDYFRRTGRPAFDF
jgi:phage-related protein